MSGEYEDKFAGERLLLAFMYAHPGKKLNFMGYEIGQFKEWDYCAGIDLFLAEKFELHAKMREFVKYLNGIYKTNPAFFKNDFAWDGLEWLVLDDKYNNFFAFSRYGGKQSVTALMNFSGVDIKNYKVGINKGKYRTILNTE